MSEKNKANVPEQIKVLLQHKILKDDEMRKLFVDYRETRDKKYRDKIILLNQRLVFSIARRYIAMTPFSDVDALFSEGNIGLLKAVEKYDPNHLSGTKFSVYAAHWIIASIKNFLWIYFSQVRLPVRVVNEIFHLNKALEKLSRSHPDADPVLLCKTTGFSLQKIDDLNKIKQGPVCLDDPVKEDGNSTFLDFVIDENLKSTGHDPQDSSLENIQSRRISNILSYLTERERRVLELRWGIGGGVPKTLEEIGKIFCVTRERIRQIEVMAIRRLKKYAEDPSTWQSSKKDLCKPQPTTICVDKDTVAKAGKNKLLNRDEQGRADELVSILSSDLFISEKKFRIGDDDDSQAARTIFAHILGDKLGWKKEKVLCALKNGGNFCPTFFSMSDYLKTLPEEEADGLIGYVEAILDSFT